MLFRIEKYPDVVKLLKPMVCSDAERLLAASLKRNEARPKQMRQLVVSLTKVDDYDVTEAVTCVAGVLNETVYRLFKV